LRWLQVAWHMYQMISSSIQVILKLLPQQFEKLQYWYYWCRNLWSIPLGWPQWHYSVTCRSDYRWGFGLDIGFIGHFYTQLGTTSNYSTIANPHTLQITTAHAKSSESTVKSFQNGGSLPTDSFLHSLPYRTDSVDPVVFLITPQHGPL
jgi:hypothetical protein